jgi:PAS domain S-box-containing protein
MTTPSDREPSESRESAPRATARFSSLALAVRDAVRSSALRRIAPLAVGAALLAGALQWSEIASASWLCPVSWFGAWFGAWFGSGFGSWLGVGVRVGAWAGGALLLVLVTWLTLLLDRSDPTHQAAENRFGGLLETIPDAVIVVDARGLICVVNPHVERLFGYRREEMLGHSVDILVPERFRSVHHHHRNGFFANPSFRAMGQGSLLTGRRKDGSEFPTQISLGPLRGRGSALASCVIRDISEQEELRRRNLFSEQRLAMAMPAEGWGTFEWELRTRSLHWSAELERLYGLEPGQFGGVYESWEALVLPEDRPSLRLAVYEAIDGEMFNADWRVPRKSDGQIRWLRSHARVHRDQNAEAVNMIGVQFDITELKAAEEGQLANQRRLALALDASHMGTWDLDLTTGLIWRSLEYDRIFGHDAPAPEWTIKTFLDRVSSDDRMSVNEELRRARTTGSLNIECRIARADGEVRWVDLRAQVFYDALKNPARMIGVIHDVDDRKRAEEKLQIVEARYRLLMDCVRDYAIYMLDTKGHILTWNQGAQRQKGYGPAEIVGQNIALFYSPEDRAVGKPKADLERAEREGETAIEDWRYRKDGSRYWERVVITALRDENRVLHGFSKFTRDLTEMKKSEEDLRRSNAELEQFAYVASHDLQEPLRMVASYTQLLAQRYRGKLDADADEFIGFAVDGARRMQRLIEDLLAYSRVGTRAKEPCLCEMNIVVRGAIRQLGMAIEESGATIEVSDLPRVWCDETQMTSLFQNLIGNAIKFRRPDASPVIRVSAEHGSAGAHSGQWVFRVADNGIGIDPRYFERIFQVFQRLQTRESHPGNGIGLAICKKIVERQDGRIWVESGPGRGTTFLFSLPHAGSPAAKEMEHDVANPSPVG